MVGGDDWRPWVPRILAPLAFFAAATALILIVHRSLTSETSATPPAATSTTATTTGATETGTKTDGNAGQKKRYYRVKPNDLLATIAEQFDTTVEDLIELNPGLDPNNLQVGQRVRVR